jgi:hypothetical protein
MLTSGLAKTVECLTRRLAMDVIDALYLVTVMLMAKSVASDVVSGLRVVDASQAERGDKPMLVCGVVQAGVQQP